jgi:hypothetical protein
MATAAMSAGFASGRKRRLQSTARPASKSAFDQNHTSAALAMGSIVRGMSKRTVTGA